MAPSGVVNRSLGKSGGAAGPQNVDGPHVMPFTNDSTPNVNAGKGTITTLPTFGEQTRETQPPCD